jgi:hypothetical protein
MDPGIFGIAGKLLSLKMREMDKNLWPILVRSTVQPAIDLIVVCE